VVRNRTVPTDTVLPHLAYRDLAEAVAWLTRVFGFAEHFRYGQPISGAQLRAGNAWIMVSRLANGARTPRELGYSTQSLTIFVEDVQARYGVAKSCGAAILEEPHETVYGEFQCAIEDLEGHRWIFSRHVRDLSPSEWGATVADSATDRT
jgi:uncharacterized glyoxalase superfamily protein PhnB